LVDEVDELIGSTHIAGQKRRITFDHGLHLVKDGLPDIGEMPIADFNLINRRRKFHLKVGR